MGGTYSIWHLILAGFVVLGVIYFIRLIVKGKP